MRFGDDIVEHEPFAVPMIGNVSTGYSIGLTPAGRAVCHRMFFEDVPEAEVAAVDENLLAHLKRGGFCRDEGSPLAPATGRAATGDGAVPAGDIGAPESGVPPFGEPLQAAYLHVTHRCNLQCAGCYSGVEERNARADVPLEDVLAMVERLAAAGVRRLIISGGEPFLRADLPQIAAGAKAAGVEQVDVLTNGTLVTEEALRALAPWADRISVSFDGADAGAIPAIRRENRFDALVAAVGLIRDAGIQPHIIPTIHGSNVGDMEAYCALAERLEATINFSLLSAPACDDAVAALVPDEAALEALARATLALSRGGSLLADTPVNTGLSTTVGCGAGCSMVSVSADGEVFPCHLMHDEAFCLGSLLDGDDCLRQRCRPAPTVDELPVCGACEIRYLCGGGCRARAFFATGDVTDRDPYCALMKTFYRLLFQAMLGTELGKEV